MRRNVNLWNGQLDNMVWNFLRQFKISRCYKQSQMNIAKWGCKCNYWLYVLFTVYSYSCGCYVCDFMWEYFTSFYCIYKPFWGLIFSSVYGRKIEFSLSNGQKKAHSWHHVYHIRQSDLLKYSEWWIFLISDVRKIYLWDSFYFSICGLKAGGGPFGFARWFGW
jgi:hypothetical protein